MALTTARARIGVGLRDGITAVLGAWLMVGLFLDGYVHNTRGDQLESFFTPWHAVLYSGFVASALWIVLPGSTTRGSVRERLSALPDGYAAGALGAAVFAVGGIGDSVWHSVLGVEVDLEALLSPPHLVLFAGGMLILTTPARAAWRRPGRSPTFGEFVPALTSVTLATLLVGFFLMYSSGLFDFHATAGFTHSFEAGGRLADEPFLFDVLTGFGVVARLVTTVLLMAPVLLIVRRWVPPRGTFTALFTAYVAFMLVLEDFAMAEMVAAGLATGLAADLLAAQLRPSPDRAGAVRLFATLVPTVLWVTHFTLLGAAGDLGWPFVLWGGVVLLAAGAGYALSVLAVTPPVEA